MMRSSSPKNYTVVRYLFESEERTSVVQYHISYFVESPSFGKDGHVKSKSKRFEPQLWLSYSYETGALKMGSLVILSLLDQKEAGSHLMCLNRDINEKQCSLIEMNNGDVKTIYSAARWKLFLSLTNKYKIASK